MPVPAGPAYLPVWLSATALALLSPLELTAAETHEEIKQAIRSGLPRYDPAAYTKALAEKAARSAQKKAPAPWPEAKPAAPAAPTAASSGEKVFELPKMTVQADRIPPKPLPRQTISTPIDNEPGEPLESPGARDARLIKNHLGKLDQILNPFAWFGASLTARARQAEFTKERARQMNELADAIEMQAALGLDPAEIKKLRAEYQKLYNTGPK